jgi:hypothetical protein
MIEAYAFLAMFMVQILAGSIVFPERVIRSVRRWGHEFSSERFKQLYPEVDYKKSVGRFVTIFRAANIVVAVLGFLLLGWFYTLVRQPDWTGELKMQVVAYIFMQFAPLTLLAVYGVVRGFKQLVQPSQEAKRTACLQRRGLFDFVSPFAVWLAVLSYFVFVVFAVYLDLEVYQNASLSRQCYIAIGAVTAIYAFNAFVIYKYLYGRKNPLVSHEGRVHSIGMNVKGAVYGSIATTCFFSLMGVVGQPHLKEWQPFALSLFLVVTWLLCLMGVSSPPRKPGVDAADSSGVTS